MRPYLIGLANASISGAVTGAAGLALSIGVSKVAVLVVVSALASAGKWFLQHPIPGGIQ